MFMSCELFPAAGTLVDRPFVVFSSDLTKLLRVLGGSASSGRWTEAELQDAGRRRSFIMFDAVNQGVSLFLATEESVTLMKSIFKRRLLKLNLEESSQRLNRINCFMFVIKADSPAASLPRSDSHL